MPKKRTITRQDLRDHRTFIHSALEDYVLRAMILLGLDGKDKAKIRIMNALRYTRVRLPRDIVPNKFMELALAENENKKYRIEFCLNHKDYIQIILLGKPLIEEGQGILLFFLRELLQFLAKRPKRAKKKTTEETQE